MRVADDLARLCSARLGLGIRLSRSSPLHGHVHRQRQAYGDPCRDPGVTEDLGELVRAAVHNGCHEHESGRGVDHPDDFQDLCYLIERSDLLAQPFLTLGASRISPLLTSAGER